ncbi:hypothetical protein PUN28_013496 [Cardiocondyla obscurior]|uniref:Uncharacterized protein n=1 Tax=Cardiocondyla obscurior TaxID=286306 RepID=A0AAW2F3T7_9HYME
MEGYMSSINLGPRSREALLRFSTDTKQTRVLHYVSMKGTGGRRNDKKIRDRIPSLSSFIRLVSFPSSEREHTCRALGIYPHYSHSRFVLLQRSREHTRTYALRRPRARAEINT